MSLDRAVAVVGIGCRFPGGVRDAGGFWRLLEEGRDAIGEIPPDRIDLARFFDPRPATPGRTMTRFGGFLDRIEQFDPTFFGISPREAERLDPQQRLLLETAWEAIEDAGIDANTLEGSATGVFVGQWLSDFEARLFADPEAIDFLMTTGSGRYSSSGRLSYLLGLQGPSLTVDTACSSSLVAVHLALRSIRSGESTLALAGGVNIILQPHISVAYSQSRMMAPDGHCKFGDAAGDGYVRSEGAGIVALKSLARALAEGDRIYAVIRGSAVNNDGHGSGSMGTPSRAGQEALLRGAYADAAVAPGRVGCIEAHGTGTRAGDPVELGALGAVIGQGRDGAARAAVGSVKTNVGHTEGAAGVAGLIKLALALHHERIPSSLHCRALNPAVDWAAAPFEIAREARPWTGAERYGGVSAFGIAGTNAHVVLQAAPPAPVAPAPAPAVPWLPLSARSPEALRAVAAQMADLLRAPAGPAPGSLGAALARRRTPLEHRAAFVGTDRAELVDALRTYANAEAPAPAAGRVAPGARPRLAFVVPGQGAQWAGMARDLMATSAVFLDTLHDCDAALRPWAEVSIVEQLRRQPGDPGHHLDRIDVLQPVLVALAIAYAAHLRDIGIVPDVVVGHSMGEVAAAHIAGVIDLGACMRIVARRSALMHRTSGRGAMALVDLSMADAQTRVAGFEARLSVAVSNSPRSSVISGEPGAVAQVMADLERDGVFCRLVKVDVASHSPQMAPLAEELVRELADLAAAPETLPIVSTVTGTRLSGPAMDAAHWGCNLRQPVRFADAARALLDDGVSVFLELAPHALLSTALQQNAQAAGRDVTALACGRRDTPDALALHTAVAGLWTAGAVPDLSRLFPDRAWPVPLPTYPWQHERHWVDAAEARTAGAAARAGAGAAKPDEAALRWLHRQEWEALPAPTTTADASTAAWLFVCDDAAAARACTLAADAAGWPQRSTPTHELAAALAARPAPPELNIVAVASTDDADAAYLPLALVQVLATTALPPVLRLWFVTRGAQSTAPGQRVQVWQAALWGAARVVAEEHPAWWGGLVDLDPDGALPNAAAALVAHLGAGSGEDQVALRGTQRFALRLRPHRHDTRAATPWRADASYLITGGQGEIALHLAQHLVGQGVRRLILLGRTPLPPRERWSALDTASLTGRRVAAIRALEATGAAVHTAALDVGDEAAVRAFLSRHAAEGWPPIRGVIHAAGSFDNQLADRMTRQAFDAVVTAKLAGAQWLDRLLPDLDLFVLFSSTGAFLAQPGQANYAAANAGLDALALDRRARGRSALSIGWGVWQGTGLVKDEAGARNVAEMQRQGIGSFEPAQGCAMFSWLCGRDDAGVAVLPIDWAAFGRARAGRSMPMFAALAAGLPGGTVAGAGAAARLAAAPPAEQRRLLEGIVREALGQVLRIAPARIDPRKAFGAMGLGSLLAMELRNRLEGALERSLSATLAWNHPSVDALVAFLAGSTQTAAPAAAESKSAPTPLSASVGATLDSVAALTDDEAALALLGRKAGTRR